MANLQSIVFTPEQKKFTCSLINNIGDGQHPYADSKSFDFFTIEYVKELIDKALLIKGMLSSKGIAMLNDISIVLK
jgi:hypothetical protein